MEVALIKRSAAKNSLIFHNAFLSQENGPADFFPIAKDDMPFTPNGILTYSLRRVRHTGSVLHSNLAKSPPFLRRSIFVRIGSLQDSINLSYLWTLPVSNTANRAGFN